MTVMNTDRVKQPIARSLWLTANDIIQCCIRAKCCVCGEGWGGGENQVTKETNGSIEVGFVVWQSIIMMIREVEGDKVVRRSIDKSVDASNAAPSSFKYFIKLMYDQPWSFCFVLHCSGLMSYLLAMRCIGSFIYLKRMKVNFPNKVRCQLCFI